jgi:hypothetical protein
MRLLSGSGCGQLLVAAAFATSGCTTAEDMPPLTRYDQAAIAAGRGPLNTGTFPNLNVPQHAAASQFTDQERDAKLAALQAERNRQVSGSAAETPEQRRRRLQLLADEQEKTLKVIENN